MHSNIVLLKYKTFPMFFLLKFVALDIVLLYFDICTFNESLLNGGTYIIKIIKNNNLHCLHEFVFAKCL